MAVSYEWVPTPVRDAYFGWYFTYQLRVVPKCNFCNEHETPRWDDRMCRECWDAFESLANRVSAGSGTHLCAHATAIQGRNADGVRTSREHGLREIRVPA